MALFARIFLKELLVDRNQLLARNILEQCRIYQQDPNTLATTKSDSRRSWGTIFRAVLGRSSGHDDAIQSDNRRSKRPMFEDSFEIIYADEGRSSGPSSDTASTGSRTKNGKKAIVAVLGMAHCNGIARLLREELVME